MFSSHSWIQAIDNGITLNTLFVHIESVSSNLIDFNTEIPVETGNTNATIHGAVSASYFPSDSSSQQHPPSGYARIVS